MRPVTPPVEPGNPLVELGRLTFDAADDAALEDGVRALVVPGFAFRQEGRRDDVDGYLAHVRGLRAAMAGGELVVLDAMLDRSTVPARAAARVHARMRMADGSLAEGEAHLLGVLDGEPGHERLAVVHETGRLVATDDDPPAPTAVVPRGS